MSVEQYFECSNCGKRFWKRHSATVMWAICPHCGGRAYPD